MQVALKNVFNFTGECPYWDPRSQELSLVDANTSGVGKSSIHRWIPSTNSLKSLEFDKCASFNIPTSDRSISLVSKNNEIWKVNWDLDSSDTPQLLVAVDQDKPDNRLNDAKCDARGLLLAGTMSPEKSPGVLIHPQKGSLFRYESGSHEAKVVDKGIDLSNGMDWTSNGSTMFFADSYGPVIFTYDYDQNTSEPSNRRIFMDFSKNTSTYLGLPDGLTMDANDRLWVACYSAGKVVQFDIETGKILQEIILPTSCTTSCCFGGPQLNDLYVTSSKFGVGNDASKGIEEAGSLFVIPASVHGAQGLPMNVFQL